MHGWHAYVLSDTNSNGICDENDIAGCTYPLAPNYVSAATMDDVSCIWPTGGGEECVGDLNNDLVVSVADLLVLLSVFGGGC